MPFVMSSATRFKLPTACLRAWDRNQPFALLALMTVRMMLTGPCTLLDFVSRRPTRVCRSTFAAAIGAVNGCCERTRVIHLASEEAFCGPIPASMALRIEEFADDAVFTARLRTHLEACVDAKAVFTAVEAKESKLRRRAACFHPFICPVCKGAARHEPIEILAPG